jgi:hypothetical protein
MFFFQRLVDLGYVIRDDRQTMSRMAPSHVGGE